MLLLPPHSLSVAIAVNTRYTSVLTLSLYVYFRWLIKHIIDLVSYTFIFTS